MAMIDIHPHVVSIDTERFPLAPIGGHQSDWSQERPVSYEQMIQAMDQAGVAKSAVVQASSAYAFDNSYVAAAVAAFPRRFTGVFSVDVLARDAVDTMKHWISKGLTGLRLYTAGSTMPEQTTWFTDAPLFELARYPNVYLKVTHRNFEEARNGRSTPEAFFGRLVKEFGADRIAWGSNFPAARQKLPELVALGRDSLAFLPQPDRDWIFKKTALTLYPALRDK
jgi:predicted TIM-barrel fold metal-dependent hydrolase